MIDKIERNKEKRTLICIVACLILVFLILTLCKVNISSMRRYDNDLPENISKVNTLTFGTPRAVRSDEWLVNVSNTFYSLNNRARPHGLPETIVAAVNIPKWGNYFLPNDMAFSFQTLVMNCILVIASVFFFRIIGKGSWFYILCATAIVAFQPGIAWWNAVATFAIFLSIIDFFYYFFVNKTIVSKLLCCLGLVICMGYYIVAAYPAWMIPLGYLAVLLLVGIYTQQRAFPIRLSDTVYIVGTIAVIGLVAACYYLTQKDFIEATMNTVYPGQRQIAGGGLRLRYLTHYLTAVKMPFKDISFLNNSEASTFLSFFPIPWVVYAVRYKQLKEHKIIPAILAFVAITFAYARIGFGDTIARYTLWSWTAPSRAIVIADFAMLLSLLMEAYYLNDKWQTKHVEKGGLIGIIVANTIVLSFLAIPVIRNNQVFKYLGLQTYILVALSVVIVLNLLIAGKQKQVLIVLLCMSIVSGATVNPVNIGTEIMEGTPLAREIKKLDTEDSGRWITNNDILVSKYTRAQGVDCLNSISYPPRFDLFAPIDNNGENEDVYNRYAHVIVSIGPENGVFELIQDDMFRVTINTEGLKLWDVKYIVSKENIEMDADSVTIARVYDDLDGYDIYKVSYK